MEKINLVYFLKKWYISGVFGWKSGILVSKIRVTLKFGTRPKNVGLLGTRPTNLLASSAPGQQTCLLAQDEL
jgi:hypothetical protein